MGTLPVNKAELAARGSRHADKEIPTLPTSVPECPAYLSDRAKELWSTYCAYLVEMDIVTRYDAGALARLVDSMALYETVVQQINASSLYCTSHNKAGHEYTDITAMVKLKFKLESVISKLEATFGLTPLTRHRIMAHRATTPSKRAASKKEKYGL